MTNTPISRAAWASDARRIIDITERTPALPEPTIAPGRVTWDYRDRPDQIARVSVAWARTALEREFGIRFAPRTQVAPPPPLGDGTVLYLLEAEWRPEPHRRVLVIASRVQLDADLDVPADRELTGAAA